MTSRVLTPAQVAERTGLSCASLAKKRWQGTGPAFVKLGEGGGASGRGVRVGYLEHDVDAWLAAHRRLSTSDVSAETGPRLALRKAVNQ